MLEGTLHVVHGLCVVLALEPSKPEKGLRNRGAAAHYRRRNAFTHCTLIYGASPI
jgi:hypothetical protein